MEHQQSSRQPDQRQDDRERPTSSGVTCSIPRRFNGPPDSGNGGYSAGVLAGAYRDGTGPAVVTLRAPVPLETTLTVGDPDPATPTGVAQVRAGAQLIAQVADAPAEPPAAVPPVSWAEASAASERYPGFVDHPFPTCYVCGPDHPNGLRIFAGPLGDGRTAAPWVVPAEVSEPVVWASLDCPGGWAIIAPGRPFVLGRVAAYIDALPEPGARCVVVGALTGVDGRKAHVTTSLYDPAGVLLGRAAATWLSVPA